MTVLPGGVLRDTGPLDAPWDCVSKDASKRWKLEVRAVDDATFALRQSTRVSTEAPIGYLLCGTERALLLDTGDAKETADCPLRETVDALLDEWAASQDVSRPPLVVAHTHGHYDHVKGDPQFAGRPDTTIVAKDVDAVHAFFGLDGTPGATTEFDLGGRLLLITAIPGHDARSIATVDPAAGLLVSGDTAYPGRLYVDDLAAAKVSLRSMVDLAEAHGVHTVLGCHVERAADGGDIPLRARFHPEEVPFALTLEQLRALRDHVDRAAGKGVHPGDPMTLYVGNPPWPMLKLLGRGLLARATGRG
ncbi:MBL fold metallo-hydrolase [Flexivirga oryzae]|uniref:Glyoxylase-like metal-dependent hydrolase (Beta-lactamase superfamily II) n=1 Tax=Flexivirga oryzae TaxID=1794944 RepID=A0A839N4Y2_9MICO|nr:MBL fold metallo-hydrolase [Flexivirga oryzae]MBB2892357.1 glyoxylase-like metal-dependent hydrolase (beta-lactamase superfamily II) [Flexivirga oryzae]